MLNSFVKFLFDENIGKTVVDYFSRGGYDVKTIIDEMKGASDVKVLKFAVKEKRVLITLDKDFAELVYKYELKHCGIILLRVNDNSSRGIIGILEKIIGKIKDFPFGKFIVVSEDNVRIR